MSCINRYPDNVLRDSEKISRIHERLKRELQEADARGDAEAAKSVTVRLAWFEELLAAGELLERAELHDYLADVKEVCVKAKAAGDVAAAHNAEERVKVIQALLAAHDDD